MKWIKPRDKFLNEEAKIRDTILPRQAKAVADTWGEQWLDLEETDPTDKIQQGKWKLSEEDKVKVLGTFLMANVASVYESFGKLPDKLNEIIKLSIKLESLSPRFARIMQNFDIKKPSIDQLCILTEPVFRKISVSETQATEMMVKDENGRPIMEEGKPKKISKEKGDIIFTKNLTNINTFIDDFNRCYPESIADASVFSNREIQRLISTSSDLCNSEYTTDFSIYDKDMYLSIKHNPKDILNMSISKFYASCQHLYTGGYREQLLSNVFDPNSIPAFLILDTPIKWKEDIISEHLPVCRMMIRNIETFTEKEIKNPKIFFDRGYPDRMKDVIGEMILKYSENKETVQTREIDYYLFTPDVPDGMKLRSPYMDKLSLEEGKYIGANTKFLSLSAGTNWSRVKVSPKANIKELIIETTDVPANLFTLNLNPDWIKFKFLKLNNLKAFDKIKSKSFAFDKCKFDGSIIKQIKESNPDLEKLQIIACETSNIDLAEFESLKELHLLFTLNDEKLIDIMGGLELDKFVVSSDILTDPDNKKYIGELKKVGIKVEIIGPKI